MKSADVEWRYNEITIWDTEVDDWCACQDFPDNYWETLMIDSLRIENNIAKFNLNWKHPTKLSPSLYGGAEFSMRDLEAPGTSITTGQVEKNDWREALDRAYCYWTPHKWLSLRGEYQFERFDWNATASPKLWLRVKMLTTASLPFGEMR